MAGSDTSKGSANCVTEHSPRASRARIARRVGSERAEKVLFKTCDEWLTMWLTIEEWRGWCQEGEGVAWLIPCARATRGLRRPSLDARSGGLIRAILGTTYTSKL